MVKARMKVQSVLDQGTQKTVKLTAVYSDDKDSPNYTYSKATPSGNLELVISNPAAYEQFTVGKTFDLTFEEFTA